MVDVSKRQAKTLDKKGGKRGLTELLEVFAQRGEAGLAAQAVLDLGDSQEQVSSPLPPTYQNDKRETAHLVPDRHPNRDFFVADLLDVSPKGDLASMEHPLFALRAGDKRVRTYERGEVQVTVKPGHDGCATIHDKDIWIYCISQLVEAMNRGRGDVGRIIQFTAHDFLVTANRQTSGEGYKLMGKALARLSGTRIETNIATDGRRERAGFGLVDAWRVIERGTDNRMVAVEVTLPDWLWRSVQARHVLTLSRDYFRIRKPIDRRIYEIARKHVGAQTRWKISIAALHEKSGSRDARRNFREAMQQLAASNSLPDYRVAFNESEDAMTFYARSASARHSADALLKT